VPSDHATTAHTLDLSSCLYRSAEDCTGCSLAARMMSPNTRRPNSSREVPCNRLIGIACFKQSLTQCFFLFGLCSIFSLKCYAGCSSQKGALRKPFPKQNGQNFGVCVMNHVSAKKNVGVCARMHVRVHVCVCVRAFMRMRMRTCVRACVRLRVYADLRAYMHACVSDCVHACMCCLCVHCLCAGWQVWLACLRERLLVH